MAVIDIQTLSASLTQARARWQPRQTPQANLNDAEKRALLGVVVDPASLAAAMAPAKFAAAAAPNFAPAVDWRNRNGNHVTSIKDQRQCGSSVPFFPTAQVESMGSLEEWKLSDHSAAD